MTIRECTALLAPMAVALGAELDEPDYRAYHRALQDVPTSLLTAACAHATRAPRDRYAPRMPTAPMLREYAEHARRTAIAASPWHPCEACLDSPRWVPVVEADGVRMTRCACWTAYQARIAAIGLATPLLVAAAPVEVEA